MDEGRLPLISSQFTEPAKLTESCHRLCLTPTRNEAWIIQQFLAAAKHWASHIIVADQSSSDGTLQELRRTPGVQTVINDLPVYDEAHRQRLLIGQARKIDGKRILVALDADEALSANVTYSKEWAKLENAAPGTVVRFRWVNILPGFKKAWIPHNRIACGFVDDGSDHTGERIHSRRVPWPKGAPIIDMEEVVVLHFQYVAPDRVRSKHRWYQAWEYLNHPEKGPLDIFRLYNHGYRGWDKKEFGEVQPHWLEGYVRAGIDYQALASNPTTWWDRELIGMLSKYGPSHFRRIAIWDKDWNACAKELGVDADFRDPRSAWEKTVHRLLEATQKHRIKWSVRGFERILRKTGW